jgi:DNA-binding beta-propeller fold protein YncE
MSRYNINTHPIAFDPDMVFWQKMGISCWPTLLVINPNGCIIGEFIGEVHANYIKRFLKNCFTFYSKLSPQSNNQMVLFKEKIKIDTIEQKLDELKLITDNNNDNVKYNSSFLSFPTKLDLSSHRKQLFISDSGNNRILVIDIKTGKMLYQIGSGVNGQNDGPFEIAQFNFPQGLALFCRKGIEKLFIADTFNNLIRCADLLTKQVYTVCGKKKKHYNNKQQHHHTFLDKFDLKGGKPGRIQPISSPWDLTIFDQSKKDSKIVFLLICCAGTHQIWLYSFNYDEEMNRDVFDGDVETKVSWWRGLQFNIGDLVCICGNGEERIKNNSYPLNASFAQPSGIAYNINSTSTPTEQHNLTGSIYIADAESSSIRIINIQTGQVQTLVGGDRLQPDNLFIFGDKDGAFKDVKLQHPIDCHLIELKNELINNSVQESCCLIVADTFNHNLKLLDLEAKKCYRIFSEENGLNEPNGVVYDSENRILYIADTNNHCIKLIRNFDLNSSITQSLFKFEDFKLIIDDECDEESVDIILRILFKIKLEAPSSWKLSASFSNSNLQEKWNGTLQKQCVTQKMCYKLKRIKNYEFIKEIRIDLNVFYCLDDNCKILQTSKVLTKEKLDKLIEKKNNQIIIEI